MSHYDDYNNDLNKIFDNHCKKVYKGNKLQLTFDDIDEREYEFNPINAYVLSDYLTDCYLGNELPYDLYKTYAILYLYKCGLLKDDRIKLPFVEIKKLSDYLNKKIVFYKRIISIKEELKRWCEN